MLVLLLLSVLGVAGVKAGLTHPSLLPLPFPPSYKAASTPIREYGSKPPTYDLEPLPPTYHSAATPYNPNDDNHNSGSIGSNPPSNVYKSPSIDSKSSRDDYSLDSTLKTPSISYNPSSNGYQTISVVYDSPKDDIDPTNNDFISSVIKLGLSYGGYKGNEKHSLPLNEHTPPVRVHETPGEEYNPSPEAHNPLSNEYRIPSNGYVPSSSDSETHTNNDNLQSSDYNPAPQSQKVQSIDYSPSSNDHNLYSSPYGLQIKTYIQRTSKHDPHSTNYNSESESFKPQSSDSELSTGQNLQPQRHITPSNTYNPKKGNENNQQFINHSLEPTIYKPASNNYNLHSNIKSQHSTTIHNLQHKSRGILQTTNHNQRPKNPNHHNNHHRDTPTSNGGFLLSTPNTQFKIRPISIHKHSIINTDYSNIGGGLPSTTAYSFPTSRGHGSGRATGYSSAQITIGSTKPKFRLSKGEITALRTNKGYRTPLSKTPSSTIIYSVSRKGSDDNRKGVTVSKRPSGTPFSSPRHHLKPLVTATNNPDAVIYSASTPKPVVALSSSSSHFLEPPVTTTTRPERIAHTTTTSKAPVYYPVTPRPTNSNAKHSTTPSRKRVTVSNRPGGSLPSSLRDLFELFVSPTTRPESTTHASTNLKPLVFYQSTPRPATTTAKYSTTPRSRTHTSRPRISPATLAVKLETPAAKSSTSNFQNYNGRSRNRATQYSENQVDGRASSGVQVTHRGTPAGEVTNPTTPSPTPAPPSLSLVHGAYGGSEYHFSWKVYPKLRYTWAEADRYCASLGPTWQLVSLERRDEHLYVSQGVKTGNLESVWTGGFRVPGSRFFVWVSGEPFRGHSWSRGGRTGTEQPDNKEGNEYYISIARSPLEDALKWYDSQNGERKACVCERKEGRQEEAS